MNVALQRILGQRNVDRLVLCRAFILMNGRKLLKTVLRNHYPVNTPPTRLFSDERYHVFFGYYDITPFSNDDTMLLAMHAPLINRSPDPESSVKVGWYDLRNANPKFKEIGETVTWCWQQGCRLQWYPKGNNKNVLYNSLIDGKYVSVVKDIHTGETTKTFNRPLYTVSNDGKWGLSLNFSRLQQLRPGYGYVNLPDATRSELNPTKDGIWRVDMETGEEKLLFSLADITQYEPRIDMNGAEHYFNHLLFNPGCTRFLFFHLWIKEGKRFSRMLTADYTGGRIHIVNNEGHVSHYCWKADSEILAFATHRETGTHYYLYEDLSPRRTVVGMNVLTKDGHPSYSSDGRTIVTDTYPDKCRVQHVLVYRVDKDNVHSTFESLSPIKFSGEVRCDLHPRISSSGFLVCIDNVLKGRRVMSVFGLRSLP